VEVSKLGVHVAAIIHNKNKFLLVKGARGSLHEGLWAFPAGGVESWDKSLEEALKREVKEETNLNVSKIKFFDAIKLGNVLILFFECQQFEGEIKPGSDVEEARWFSLDEMRSLKMRPAMYKIIKKLKAQISPF
jgi:8-oxo-dGTP diphosphatase